MMGDLRACFLGLPMILALAACGGAASPKASSGPTSPVSPMPNAANAPKTSVGSSIGSDLFPEGMCGGFETLPLSTSPTSLLDSRLSIQAVEGLADLARPRSIMAAPSPEQGETRLFLERGGKKLVVFAEELFKKAGPDFAAAVKKIDHEEGPVKVGALSIQGLPAIAIVPQKLIADTDAVLVLKLYVTTPDRTVQRISFYVSPEVIDSGAGCAAFARKMALTLKPGDRALDLSGGPRKLDPGITVTVPRDIAMMLEPGPDFMVYHFHVVNALDAPSGSLGIYVGSNPQNIEPGTDVVSGTLFGKPAKWADTNRDGLHSRQSLVEIPGQRGVFTHVFFGAEDDATFKSLASLAESVK